MSDQETDNKGAGIRSNHSGSLSRAETGSSSGQTPSSGSTPGRRFFPYDEVRDEQGKLINACYAAVSAGSILFAHAPTGLGKTVASLAPAIEYALDNDKVVVFVTGRHTQHEIALETVEAINKKFLLNLKVVNIIGKKHLCLQENVGSLKSKDFSEYCRLLREDKKCEFFENLRKKGSEELSQEAISALKELDNTTGGHQGLLRVAANHKVCPYELAMIKAREANVIVTDYQYLFNPDIRELLLRKINRSLSDIILIVDEAHNLPDRVKELGSDYLSSVIIGRALKEANDFEQEELARILGLLSDFLEGLAGDSSQNQKGAGGFGNSNSFRSFSNSLFEERYVDKELLIALLEDNGYEPSEVASWFLEAADIVRDERQVSYLGVVGSFLKLWLSVGGVSDGFVRIVSKRELGGGGSKGSFSPDSSNDDLDDARTRYNVVLSCRCLDPSVITSTLFDDLYSAILMSGTFHPTSMYANLLGVSDYSEVFLRSPFPKNNRLALIVPKSSTRYSSRNEATFKQIGELVAKIVDVIPGNVAVFFPSYYLLREVKNFLQTMTVKTVLSEHAKMSREEKNELLDRFREYKNKGAGALLLGVISGNFGEGIDLPGDELKGVVVVGLPFQKPDLEAKALIEYYDKKFGKGWDYGYNIPAFNKVLQSAGRCIRTETDKGVVVFLDERYAEPRYKRLFPEDWDPKITLLFEFQIRRFFGNE